MKSVLLIGLGGFVGANTRYLVCDWTIRRWGDTFPFGTLIVNVAGSFMVGLLAMLLADKFTEDPYLKKLIITGFLGAFSTFSSYMVEVLNMVTGQSHSQGWAYLAGTIVLGLVAVIIGAYVGSHIHQPATVHVPVH